MEYFVFTSWTAFKTLAITKQLGMQYVEFATRYDIYINEGVLVWSITLNKDTGDDVTDFESVYKALSNRPTFFHGQFRNKFRNITGNTTVTVKTGNGVLRGISINDNNTGGTITVYDNTAGSGTKIGTFQIGTQIGALGAGVQGPISLPLTAEFATGLTVVTTGSTQNDITIYYV